MRGARGHARRRSWGQRLFIACNVVAIVAAGLTATVLAYGNRSVADLDRVQLGEVLARNDRDEGDPENILLVGIDNASGLPEGDPVRNRTPADLHGQNTDTIMVLRLDPEEETAQLLSLPRDLWVPIAGSGSMAKINAAFALRGAPGLIETIDENFGIPIHRYLQVDMAGFRQLVDIVDGVPVLFPRPARDGNSGLHIPEPGCYRLGPEQALGFARGRYYDVQDDNGKWHREPGSDLARNRRQQLFVQLTLAQAIAKGGRNLNTLRQLIDLGSDAVQPDELTAAGDLVHLGSSFRTFDAEDLETFNLPVREGRVGRASVVFLEEAEAEPVLSVFRGTSTESRPHLEGVTVRVQNGTGIDEEGNEVSERLAAAGFATDVPESGWPSPATTIRYAEGSETAAQLLARYITGPVTYTVDPGLAEDDPIVLVTGSDWEGVATTPKDADEVARPPTMSSAPSSAPSSTTPSSTTPSRPTTPDADDRATDSDDQDEFISPLDVGPDDPNFYVAVGPPIGADCARTP